VGEEADVDTTTFTDEDIDLLRSLMMELHTAGRTRESSMLARAHAIVCEVVYAHLFEGEDDDEEFARDVEEAERDFAAGVWLSHDEVMRRLGTLQDG
jgi:hypothetical protein